MEDYHKPDQQTIQVLRNIANRLRINCIKATTTAGNGHPTSCCSVAEIMSVLFFHTMRYRPEDPRHYNNDRFLLSKGHAAPALYSMWVETGFLKENEINHPNVCVCVCVCVCIYIYIYIYIYLQLPMNYRVFCLMGDGEMSEGSVWEAMSFASYYQLDNLVAILDINRLGQSDTSPLQHHVDKYYKRFEAFGWHAIIVDGHSVEELCKALSQPRHQPTAIIAKTIKGKGIPAAEDKQGWHAKPLPKDMAEMVAKDLQSRIMNSSKHLYPSAPTEDSPPVSLRNIRMPSAPSYKAGEKISTRKAYGMALAKLGRYYERVVALDGDTNNLTYSEIFKNEHPNRFVECYIAQQNMVSVAVGCAARDRNLVFASTLASFFTRTHDQLRMAAMSESNVKLCGSHCGLSNGEEGPSLMALEDLAMFRALPSSTIFYPSDGVSTEKATDLAATTKGLCYIRTSRHDCSIIYNSNEDFHVGQAKVVYQSKDDQVTVVAAGMMIHEALAAAEHLKKGIMRRVLTVEDHYYEGGLGEALSSVMVNEQGYNLHCLAVSHVPRSGKPHELLKIYGIDRDAIVQAVRKLMTSCN
uniref:Transketolase n=1 Tax=Neogobius melanostomus TaxID=47308 RepID=A0A8C6UKC3_9GOBI